MIDLLRLRGNRPALTVWVSIVALIGATHFWMLSLGFLGDDFAYVAKFAEFPIARWPGLFVREWSEGLWGTPLRELRPITALSFWFDGVVWGSFAPGYHLTNIILHTCCSGLIALIGKYAFKGTWYAGAAAGLLFALHPVHIETVGWITARADLLAAGGFLLAFYSFVRYRHTSRLRWLIIASVAFAAGIFSKEFCLILPLVAIGFDLLQTRTERRMRAAATLLAPYGLWLGIALAYYVCRNIAFGGSLGAPELAILSKDFWRTVAQREMIYIGELLWPIREWLPKGDEDRRFALQLLLRMVGSLIAVALLIAWRDRNREFRAASGFAFYAVIWFLLTTLPFVVTYVSTRHIYLASAGLCLAVATMLERFLHKPRIFAIGMALLLVGCGVHFSRLSVAWRFAGDMSKEISSTVDMVSTRATAGDVLLLDVPPLVRDVWLWSWASPFALRPPFQGKDLTRDLIVLENPAVYFDPGKWAAQPSIATLHSASGRVWVVTAPPVRTSVASGLELRLALQKVDAGWPSPATFRQLVDTLRAGQSGQ